MFRRPAHVLCTKRRHRVQHHLRPLRRQDRPQACALYPAALHRVGARNDYSYGVYIYAFPVQQILADLGVYRAGFPVYTAVTLLVTGVAAYGSWHLVEKRALLLKDRPFPVPVPGVVNRVPVLPAPPGVRVRVKGP